MIRKIAISLNCLLLAIIMTITPVQRAQAAIAIPLGMGAAAGLYVVGGLAVAGLATVVGLEHGDAIREHSLNVWDGATTAAKDSMDWSLNQWQTLQNGVLPIGDALSLYIEKNIPNIVSGLISSIYADEITNIGVIKTDPSYISFFNVKQTYGIQWIRPDGYQLDQSHFDSLTFSAFSIGFGVSVGGGSSHIVPYKGTTMEQTKAAFASMTTIQQAINYYNSHNAAGEFLYLDFAVNSALAETYNQGVSSTREAWQDMKDAGLVLPNTGVTTYTGDTLVNYDAQAGQYVGIDGNVYNPSDLTWKFPTVKTRTGTADIPAGTYVDSPALTGNPAIDQPLINNPAIPKTTTNVNTGVTYANPDIATDTPINPPITGVPPAPTTGLNLLPLQIAGSTLTNKFPFSIPWDLIRQLAIFDVEPEAPVFKVDIQQYLTFPELGISIPFKMDIDLSFLEPVAAIARWGTIISFDIALILMLRRLLPE